MSRLSPADVDAHSLAAAGARRLDSDVLRQAINDQSSVSSTITERTNAVNAVSAYIATDAAFLRFRLER